MNPNRQDNKASVPNWLRSLIVFCHGYNCMDLIDLIGCVHDFNLQSRMNRRKANRLMIGEMVSHPAIPSYLSLTFWVALVVYTALPDYISRFYWRV